MKPIIIGITGASGSGKSSILKAARQMIGFNTVEILSQDHYYKPIEQQTLDKDGMVNFDLPTGINQKKYVHDVKHILSEKILKIPAYNYNNPNAKTKMLTFFPTKILFLEGLFLFKPYLINAYLDLKIFIESPNEVNFKRRLKRDQIQRGQKVEQIEYQWKNHVLPTYHKYLLPQKEQADFIIKNQESKRKSAQILVDFLQQKGISF